MIVAVIPTRYNPPTLAPLLAVLAADGIPAILKQSVAYNHELHVMWNTGVNEARAMGATEVAILNDDITILPGTLQRMSEGLRSWSNAAVVFPEIDSGPPNMVSDVQTHISPKFNCGHCFMFKAELDLPPFPERFHLWWGDVVFFETARAMGYDLVVVTNLVVNHVGSFSVSQVFDEREIMEDQMRRVAEIGETEMWRGRRYSQRIFRKRLNRLGIPQPEE